MRRNISLLLNVRIFWSLTKLDAFFLRQISFVNDWVSSIHRHTLRISRLNSSVCQTCLWMPQGNKICQLENKGNHLFASTSEEWQRTIVSMENNRTILQRDRRGGQGTRAMFRGWNKQHSIASLLLDWSKLFVSIVCESRLGGDMATTRRYLDLNSNLSSTLLDGDVSATPININCLDPLGRTALLIGLSRW